RAFFFSSRRRHTRSDRDWSSDVCSSDLRAEIATSARRLGEREKGVQHDLLAVEIDIIRRGEELVEVFPHVNPLIKAAPPGQAARSEERRVGKEGRWGGGGGD